MKRFFLLISFCFLSPSIFSQTDSSQSASSSFLIIDDSIIVENKEPVSMAGAISLSFMFPGTGLFLSENYGPAAAYLGVGGAFYVTGLTFLLSGESPNEDVALPFFLVGGFIHLASIVHTVIATNEYNENVFPFVSYNGKSYQVGFSIKF
jgi:hypothetical protein